MIDNALVGQNLRQIREAEGYSMEKIAEFLKVEEAFLNRVEAGELGIPSDLLEKLSALYFVSVSDIIGEDDILDKIPESLRDNSENIEDLEQAKEEIIEESAEDDIPAADESENTRKADLAERLQTCFAVGLILVGMFGIIRKLTGKE